MKKKYKWILLTAIAVISLTAYGAVLLKPVDMETEMVEYGNLEKHVTVSASVVPVESTILSSRTAGNVTELPYQAGAEVKAGDVLLRTDSVTQTTLDLQREQSRQQLIQARQQYDRLFGENGTAFSALATAKSQYDLAQKNYDNGSVLAAAGSLAQSDLDALKTQRDLAYEAYLQAKEGSSDSTKAYYKEQITSWEKQLSLLEDTVSPGAILMPYDGVLWEIYAETGAYLAPNQQVVKVYKKGNMKLVASVLSEDAVGILTGQTAQVVYADGTKDQAEVTFISNTATEQRSSVGLDENRSTVELRPAALPEYTGAGQKADVSFTVVKAEHVCSVPSSALVPDGERTLVYVVQSGRAEAVPVETGMRVGGRVEILSGITEGDIIAADPYNDNVKDGSRVKATLRE